MLARVGVILVSLALLAGCGRGSFTVDQGPARAADYSPAERIRVMLAPAGSDEAAARIVSARVVEVLQQTHGDVALLPTSDPGEALAQAREAKAVYLIAPTIGQWKNATAPPFDAARVEVKLELRDVASGQTIGTATFTNTSSLFAVVDATAASLLNTNFNSAVTALVNGERS